MKASAAAGVALAAAPYVHAQGRDTKYTTALVGSGWWGTNILRCALQAGQSKLVALCDVDTRQLDRCAAEMGKVTADTPKRYEDYREMLAKEKPQIVINATPDHWHPLVTIAAVGAGAHVYVEKPISHTVLEGTAMVKAARAAERVVQVGTHRRVSPHNMSANKFLREGKLGKIGMVRAFVHYGGGPGEPVPDSDTPEGLNWDMWCGPGPLRPFNRMVHPKGFRSFLDYANGQLGDWGIHWLDQIMWWTEEKHPKRVFSTAARHIKKDNTDAPDTQVVTYEFDSFTAVWEHRQYAGNEAEKHNIGCYFYGTAGTLHLGWLDGWTFYPSGGRRGEARPEIVHENPKLNEPDQQNIRELWADFLGAIAEKRRSVCDIEVGHRSTTLALLGMLSAKLGRSVQWDGEKQACVGDEAANKLLRREYRAPWKYPEV